MKIRHLVAAAATLACMAVPAPAAACPLLVLDARLLGGADVAFVGIVQSVSRRVATISVLEVWGITNLERVVEVVVGDGQPPGLNTGDRTFVVGMRYLVVPFATDDGLQDNVCSKTQPWTDELVKLRPATARPPLESQGMSLSLPLLIAMGAAATVGMVSFLVFRRAK